MVLELTGRFAARSVQASGIGKPPTVDKIDGLLQVIHARDGHHWAEDLLFGDGHVRRHLVEHGWGNKKPVGMPLNLDTAAVKDELGPFILALFNIPQHTFFVGSTDHRPHLGRGIQAISHAKTLGCSHKFLLEFLVDVTHHYQNGSR